MGKSLVLLAIPLILSVFTHLWNPIGFPAIHPDEGTYTRRAMHILAGLGPQEFATTQSNEITIYDHPYHGQIYLYDHPYFGQLYLAAILGLIGYPPPHSTSTDTDLIGFLYLIPRLLMGALAVIDTLLVYKIAEYKYNKKIAFLAATLFAVMPIGWLLRRILLDNLLLPLVLSSLLFAVRLKKPQEMVSKYAMEAKSIRSIHFLTVMISGIFLGLAILTKIPVFTFIPVVAFLVYINSGKSIKSLGLWFIPVILIPIMWPAYAISVGEWEYWFDGVARQSTGREDRPLLSTFETLFRIDPVLFLLSTAGIIFAAVQRDYMILFWIIPFIVFFYFFNFTSIVYLVGLLPPFCIATAAVILNISSKLVKRSFQRVLSSAVCCVLVIFGLVTTTMLITIELNSSFFEAYAVVTNYLVQDNSSDLENWDSTMIGRYWTKSFVWIPKFVFQKDFDFIRDDTIGFYAANNRLPTDKEKILLIADGIMINNIMTNKNQNGDSAKLGMYYNITSTVDTIEDDNARKYDKNSYPYVSLRESRGIGDVEIRSNLGS